ncbi:MAG TPA: zf-HC2 domain-containing protein [Steroidobacteraceae bacterium]|nr:zf-HC2 domain-containing protein [Steroidobacteraceae bacterium]
MDADSEPVHAAIAAWIEGSLTPAQRQQFEAHLATCSQCQEQASAALKARISETTKLRILAHTPAPPAAAPQPPARRARPLWLRVLLLAVLVVAIGYALGWWAWDLSHH